MYVRDSFLVGGYQGFLLPAPPTSVLLLSNVKLKLSQLHLWNSAAELLENFLLVLISRGGGYLSNMTESLRLHRTQALSFVSKKVLTENPFLQCELKVFSSDKLINELPVDPEHRWQVRKSRGSQLWTGNSYHSPTVINFEFWFILPQHWTWKLDSREKSYFACQLSADKGSGSNINGGY